MRTPPSVVTSSGARSSMGMASPSGRREIDGGARRDDVEGDAVCVRQDREAVGADLVGDVAVGGDAVGADEDRADAGAAHHVRGHVVGDQRQRDAGALQLPGGEARALQHGARLVHVDVEALAGLVGDEDRRERGAHAGGGERAGVAVGQQRVAVGDQLGAEAAHRATGGGVFGGDGVRLGEQARGEIAGRGAGCEMRFGDGQQAIQRPGEVDGGGARGAEARGGCGEGVERGFGVQLVLPAERVSRAARASP